MLPNWYETCVINLAAALAGLIVNPLLPIYREREAAFMLADSESELLFIPTQFRNFDYRDLVAKLRPQLLHLRDVIVVRGDGDGLIPYERYVRDASPASLPHVSADAVKMLIYTSGTTGRPKGVLHSHNTMLADVRSLAKFWSVDDEHDCFFVPSPVTHIGGSLYAHEFVWYSGTPAVLMDTWDGAAALRLVKEFKCTISAGATPFLKDLVDVAQRAGETLPSLRMYICGGAAVPPGLIRLAHGKFANCIACRVYGSTEVPTVTGGALPSDDEAACADTDGALCGTDVLIADPESGAVLPAGSEGEILVRGPEMFLGYSDFADNVEAFTADGYFKTGDLGRMVDDRHLVITGRKKDMIIRAGENISAKELEDLLGEYPAISEVSVVSVPSQRTGEAVCACVVRSESASITLADIARFMRERGSARQKIPEALLVLDSLPRTATGKVRKDELRRIARTEAVWADKIQ
jgi:acyl-CoA synthetase (AMP-forming)/AMP-acid ligase II